MSDHHTDWETSYDRDVAASHEMKKRARAEQTAWWSEAAGFFGPDYLKEYEGTLPIERTTREVAFIERILDLKASAELELLDVPCGHGRHSVEFAARGYNVTGVDLNRFFLDEAEKAAQEEGVPVHLMQCDMRELTFAGEFDVALNLFTAIGYFDDEREDARFVSRVFAALKPGGRFVIDTINPSWLYQHWRPRSWQSLPDGRTIIMERRLDYATGYTSNHRTTIALDGTRCQAQLRHRLYQPTELIAMARRVGFRFMTAYGDFTEVPLHKDHQRMILIFQKPS